MSGDDSPITGLNTTIEHDGKTYHVQTEDSGTRRPHVISHLFADGGKIVATRRTDYAEILDAPDRVALVKRLIRAQHRSMLAAVRSIAGRSLPVALPALPLHALLTRRDSSHRVPEQQTATLPTAAAAPSDPAPDLDEDVADLEDVIVRDLITAFDPE